MRIHNKAEHLLSTTEMSMMNKTLHTPDMQTTRHTLLASILQTLKKTSEYSPLNKRLYCGWTFVAYLN